MLEQLIINGGAKLKGSIKISGAKNAALPILAATILTDEKVTLHNVPDVTDIKFMGQLIQEFGGSIEQDKDTFCIQIKNIKNYAASYELVRKMRASFFVLGPLLARNGYARVSLPGGCAIGNRPTDIHISALQDMGAEIFLQDGYVNARVKDRLQGTVLHFPFPTVGGTENIMMAATLAKGTTVIHNAAKEPEIIDLAKFLNKMGAKIEGYGTSKIVIEGVDKLRQASYTIMPDRLETVTYACAALLTNSTLKLTQTDKKFLKPLLDHFHGVMVEDCEDGFLVYGLVDNVVDITTAPYPGFPTDLQAQTMVLLTQVNGQSTIQEKIFENRFMHVPELCRMGADIKTIGSTAYINGKATLKGAAVMATDLRASVSLVLAALVAEGQTIIKRIYHLDRGYADLEQKLLNCGVHIERLRQVA